MGSTEKARWPIAAHVSAQLPMLEPTSSMTPGPLRASTSTPRLTMAGSQYGAQVPWMLPETTSFVL